MEILQSCTKPLIWFVFSCGFITVNFTHILQDYLTDTGAILWLPHAGQVTLKNMSKIVNKSQILNYNHNKTKHNKTMCIL